MANKLSTVAQNGGSNSEITIQLMILTLMEWMCSDVENRKGSVSLTLPAVSTGIGGKFLHVFSPGVTASGTDNFITATATPK